MKEEIQIKKEGRKRWREWTSKQSKGGDKTKRGTNYSL